MQSDHDVFHPGADRGNINREFVGRCDGSGRESGPGLKGGRVRRDGDWGGEDGAAILLQIKRKSTPDRVRCGSSLPFHDLAGETAHRTDSGFIRAVRQIATIHG